MTKLDEVLKQQRPFDPEAMRSLDVPTEEFKTSAAVGALALAESSKPAATRLTTGEVILTMSQLGKQLDNAVSAFMTLPNETPKTVAATLENIITACKAASEKASKLLAASR